jgi:hypothetical protein
MIWRYSPVTVALAYKKFLSKRSLAQQPDLDQWKIFSTLDAA